MAEAEAEALPCNRRRDVWGPAEGDELGQGRSGAGPWFRQLRLATLDA